MTFINSKSVNNVDDWKDPDFVPVETKALQRRLRSPKKLLPEEAKTDRLLRQNMIRSVKPYLKNKNAMTALYNYVHDVSIYKKFTNYAFGGTKVKPPGFDICQKILHDPQFKKGAPTDLTLYRCIQRQELEGAFLKYEPKGDVDMDIASGLWYVNRNVSTSIAPMGSLRFVAKKEPGPKCCMLVFKIPKGYPYIYIPALFSNDLTEAEKKVFLPSGEYFEEEGGFTVKVDPQALKMQKLLGSKVFDLKVSVMRPLRRFSPFVTGPKTMYDIPYLRKEIYKSFNNDKGKK